MRDSFGDNAFWCKYSLQKIEKAIFHYTETKRSHWDFRIWLYTTYYIHISIISITSFLYDVLRTCSVVFIFCIISTQLIALSHESEDLNYRKKLKYIYYDKATLVNCYTYSNDSKIIKEIDNLIILISQQFLQFLIQSSSILDFETLFERWIQSSDII